MSTWQIIPGKLWQGDIFSLSNPDGVDVCVSCTWLSEIPVPFAFHAIWPFADPGPLPSANWLSFVGAMVADLIGSPLAKDGKKVLVNCNEGCNRSGLVIGLAMANLGMKNIFDTIHAAHPGALYNPVFKTYVANLG